MKDCTVKSFNSLNGDTVSRSLKSILGLNPEYSSSCDSLLTLLDASIANQQSRFNSLTQVTTNMSNLKKSDDELQAIQSCETALNDAAQDSSRKKKKKRKDREKRNDDVDEYKQNEDYLKSNKYLSKSEFETPSVDNVLHKKAKKRKHERFSASETEDKCEKTGENRTEVEEYKQTAHHSKNKKYSSKNELETFSVDDVVHKKPKKRKHKQSSLSETEDVVEKTVKHEVADKINDLPHKTKKRKHRTDLTSAEKQLISPAPEINQDVIFNEPDTLHKKPKKRKHKQSSASEAEESAKTKDSLEYVHSDTSKKIKKKKKHKHYGSLDTEEVSEETTQQDYAKLESVSSEEHERLTDNELRKKKKKKRDKEGSILSTSDNENQDLRPPESTSTTSEKVKKKKHKHVSIVETPGIHEDDEKLKSDVSELESDEVERDDQEASTSTTTKRPKTKKKIDPKKYYLTAKLTTEKSENDDAQEASSSNVMDYINEKLDTVLEEQESIENDMSILNDLNIMVPWVLPKSHTIETRLSHPTKEQYKEFKELDMKSGPYSKEEDQKIKTNWEEFCRDHDLKVSPMIFFPVKGGKSNLIPTEQRINFVRYVGKGLEHRTLVSIYNRFQLLFKGYKKGKFSQEEDAIIVTYAENSNVTNIYSVLSVVLNRERSLIKKRHKVLQSDDDKFFWTIGLMQALVNNLLEVTGKADVEDLKEFSIKMSHYKEIEKKMNMPAPKLKRKWDLYVYPRLFVDEYDNLSEIREKLITILYESNETDRKNINWNQLALYFNGLTGARLYKIFLDMLDRYVPVAEKNNFRDAVLCLKESLPRMLLKTKRLKRFIYRNGQLFDTRILEPHITF